MAKDDLLNVKVKKGAFYVSDKEDKGEGWVKNEFTDPNDKDKTMVRYHKEVTVKGRVAYMAMRDDKYRGKVLSLIIQGEEESYALSLPIMSNGTIKSTDQYFNSVVGSLAKVKYGDVVTMFVNNKNKDKDGRLYQNIIILDSEGKLIKSDYEFSEIPKWEKTESENDFGEKVTVWDPSPANKFFIKKLNEAIDQFSGSKPEKTEEAPQEEAKAEAPKKEVAPKKLEPSKEFDLTEDDDEDLPF